jgi:hypothetical protein
VPGVQDRGPILPGKSSPPARTLARAHRGWHVHTPADNPRSRLRAGETTNAALLMATELGLSTCPLSAPLDIPALRARIRRQVLHCEAFPQFLRWP